MMNYQSFIQMAQTNHQATVIVAGAPEPALDFLPMLEAKYQTINYIGVDRGAWRLLSKERTPKWAIGDFDSLTHSEWMQLQEQVAEVYGLPSDKDQTDLQAALDRLVTESGDQDYYLLGTWGSGVGRLSHLLANIWLAYEPHYQTILSRSWFVERNCIGRLLYPGSHSIQPIDQTAYLSLISLTAVTEWSIQGAKYSLSDVSYTQPQAFISNEFVGADTVHVSFDSGIVLALYEPMDR